MIRTIAAGLIGNTLEWYDFSIYGYFAASVGAAFFPAGDPVAQILAAFGVFAVGYVMRPLGGTFLGYIGDRFGRKIALSVSISSMVIPTFMVGLLPTYAMIGLAAPIILTLLRVFQGISVGGEFTTSIVFLVERAPPGRRGLIGAVGCAGASVGCLLGSGLGALLSATLPADMMAEWGWRVPFLLGLILGIAGVILRRHIHDAPAPSFKRPTLASMISNHLPLVLRFAGMACLFAVSYYLMFLYVVSWLQMADGIAPTHSLAVATLSETALIPATLFMGWLSDKVGRKAILVTAAVLAIVGAWPLLWMMHHPSALPVLVGQTGFVIIVGMVSGAIPAALVEATPYHVRCTVVALGYNTALGIIGGLTPLAAQWLIQRTMDDLSPAYMIIVAGVISLFATLFQRETYQDPLKVAGATA